MNRFLTLLPLWMAFLLLMSFSQVSAQKMVKGSVTDAADGSTIPGVNVVVKGTTVGTLTDIDGNFTLNVPAGKEEISFSMVGYTTVTLAVGNQSVLWVPVLLFRKKRNCLCNNKPMVAKRSAGGLLDWFS